MGSMKHQGGVLGGNLPALQAEQSHVHVLYYRLKLFSLVRQLIRWHWVNKSGMSEGPQTAWLEERNASPFLNLLGGMCLRWRGRLALWWTDACWFYPLCVCADAVLGMTFLPGLMKLMSSVCYLVLDTSPWIFHDAEGREVARCFQVSSITGVMEIYAAAGAKGHLSQLNTCSVGDLIMLKSGTSSGGTCTHSRGHCST